MRCTTINMKFLLVLLALLTAILPSAFAADPVTDKVFAITHYAEQYEMGEISYAELRVYSGAIREDVRELMSEQVFGEGDNQQKGVSEDAAKKFFGEPTEYTSWIWSSKEEKDVKIENKMPRWEKIVYDGKKIQVTFNAWPQVFKTEEGERYYYWVDFNIRFKAEFNFDISAMQSEIAALGRAFLEKRSELKDFAQKLVEYSTTLQNYLQQNKENCREMLKKYFSSEDKSMEQEYISWETELYIGDRLQILATTRVCDSCEWVFGDTWFEPRYEGPGFEKFEVRRGAGSGNYKIEDLRQKTMDELLGLLREQFDKAKKAADSAEKEGGFHIEDVEANMRLLNRAISEIANQGESSREKNKAKYISAIESITSQYRTEKSTQKELRYEKRLVEDFVDKTSKNCRQTQEEECAINEGCIEGGCRIAIGGNEDCRNKADDDGDTLIDCRDPDCAKSCGRVCKSKCEGECWPCMQQCNSACKECDDCRNNRDGEECNELCSEGCDSCRNEKCWDTSKCTDCRACEDANRQPIEGECDMQCAPCVECASSGANETCEEECKPCNECKSPAVNPECMDKCKQITQGFMGMLEPCEGMCRKGVIFYCSGSKQYSPCDDTEYICSGNIQPIPCELYTCKNEDGTERTQTVTCDQQAFCGKNQVADGDKCRCRAGFYDCDDDPLTCESESSCGAGAEVCDDSEDNDNDYMFDCEDLMDCKEGTPCDAGKVCFGSKCLLQEEANVSARCGDGFEYIDDECRCIEGYKLWEGKCMPQIVIPYNITCEGGFELKDGVCVQKEVPAEPNVTECPQGYDLRDGICVAEEIAACPSAYEMRENECVFVGVIVECAEDEVLEAGRCISRKVFEGTEIRPIETGKECTLAEDCGSERGVCSNGFCKEIPQEVYEREYEKEIPEQAILPVEEKVDKEKQEAEQEDIKEERRGEKEEEAEERQEKKQEREEPESHEAPLQEERNEPVSEQPSEEITGAFFRLLTGFASKDEKKCASDEDCKENQQCDTFMGRCNCAEGWVDCNGRGDGSDSDGCESNDITCGGNREICGGGCKENQYCNEKKGWCECSEGFFECDGNWMNGCETDKMCKPCETNDDCSKPVCAEWDNVVIKFGCAEGDTWKEENGVVAFSGGCNYRPTGRVDPYLGFDAWGTAFEDVDTMRRTLETEQFGGWCRFERESMLKQRKEIEKGLNTEFLAWYFNEYLAAEPGKWENRISGIYDIYWSIVDNARETARASACMGEKFSEYNPIDIEYESDFGKVRIWEERVNVKEFDNLNVLTPYMEIWIFPPKQILKEELIKAREGGFTPGPPEERRREIGPTPDEVAQAKKDPKLMEEINDITSDFGGSFEGLLSIKDGDEAIYYLKTTLNSDVLFKGEPVKTAGFEPDVKVDVQLDFLYDIIKKAEQHGEIQSPPWDTSKRVRRAMSNAIDQGMIVAKIVGAIATGDIKVEPLSAVPKVLTIVRLLSEQDEGGKGPVPEQ